MVRFLTLLLVFAASPAFALIQASQLYVPACGVQLALPPGVVLPAPGIASQSLVTLGCRATAANTYCSARRAGATAAYTVPTGRTLKVFARCAPALASASSSNWLLGYGNTDVGYAAAAAPTSPFWMYNDTTNVQYNSGLTGGGNNSFMFVDFDIPAGKIPAGQTDNASMMYIFGYEY